MKSGCNFSTNPFLTALNSKVSGKAFPVRRSKLVSFTQDIQSEIKSFEKMSKRRTQTSAPLPFKKEYKKPIVTGYSSTHNMSGFVPKGKTSNSSLHRIQG